MITRTEKTFNTLVGLGVYTEDQRESLCNYENMSTEDIYKYEKYRSKITPELIKLFEEKYEVHSNKTSIYDLFLLLEQEKLSYEKMIYIIKKLNKTAKYINEKHNAIEVHLLVLLLDYCHDYNMSIEEINFIYNIVYYGDIDIKSNVTWTGYIGKNLSKNKLFKASILLSNFDLPYKDFNFHILESGIGEDYLTKTEIIELGKLIEKGEIDEYWASLAEEKEDPFGDVYLDEFTIPFLEVTERTTLKLHYVAKKWGKKLNLIAIFKVPDSNEFVKLYIYKDFQNDKYGKNINFKEIPLNTIIEVTVEAKQSGRTDVYYTDLIMYNVISTTDDSHEYILLH